MKRSEIEFDRSEPRTRFGRLSLKTALFMGFGLTLGVWAFAGLYFGSRIAELDRQTSEISQRYLLAQRLLTTARMGVLQSSVRLRDALLLPDGEEDEEARLALTRELDQAAESLARYVPVVGSSEERAQVERLVVEITQLRQAMLEMLSSGPDSRPERVASFLRGELTPRRQEFMTIAEELGTLNRTMFVTHRGMTTSLYGAMQRRIWQVLGLTLVAGLGIAGMSTIYVARLERRIQAQHARDIELQKGLQRLSAELMRVREEERRSLARELHDEVGQLLTAAKFQIAAAQRSIDEQGGPPALLDDVRPIVERALQTVRDLSHLLHPAVLDDLGLSAAVDLHVKEFRRRHGAIRVELTETGLGERLPLEVETVAYRIVQEGLTNIAKHARAKSCRVSIIRLARSLMVVVGDDGAGFDQKLQPARGGLGLVSMRERVLQVGGSFVVESAPGRGTRIVVELPAPQVGQRPAEMPVSA